MKRLLVFLLIFTLCLSLLSCSKESDPVKESDDTEGFVTTPSETSGLFDIPDESADTAPPAAGEFDPELFTERDLDPSYDERDAVIVELRGDSAAASSNGVVINGSTVTLTEDRTYVISGSLDDGMIIVDADPTAKPQLVFNRVEITSQSSAALYVVEADKVFVTLAEGSENRLANGGGFTAIDENNINAALYSKQDLTMNGKGSLEVTSPAGHAVACKDDLVITGGSYTLFSADHAVNANDSFRFGAAALEIDAGKDGIHCENTDDATLGSVHLSGGSIAGEAEGDGISAGSSLSVNGTTIDLLVGGGSANATKQHSDSFGGFMGGGRPGAFPESENDNEDSTSMKGLKAEGELLITGGSITVDSADDSLHSNGSITIGGGSLTLASGDDAVHADESLTVTECDMVITESYEGLEALDIVISGGDITLTASDDGLNAAGGNDQSGTAGGRDAMFGRPGAGPGGGFGGMSSNSNGSIKISGGKLYIKASGDGIDSNGSLEISGGSTVVCGPTRGDTSTLDYDTSATITGGSFIGTGASGMAQTFGDSSQGVIALSVGGMAAGSEIRVCSADGETVVSYSPELDFAIVIISTPDIIKGERYSVTIGAESGEFEAA